MAVVHIPRATPACGKSVIPKYLQICGSHFVAFALTSVPVYLPRQRNTIYTTPIPTIATSVNTLSSSSAPLITKNNANNGDVHLSDASIKSCDNGQILQNTVPSIIHTSNEEKPICTGPTSNFSIDKDTVINTNAIVIFKRFVLELNIFSSCVNNHPMIAPSKSEHTISINGFTRMEIKSIVPLTSVFAIPKDTANTINPTASSNATIGKRSWVNGPFALYCLTTISVAAGAVAVAIAPRVIVCATVNLSGIITCTTISAKSTNKVAVTA